MTEESGRENPLGPFNLLTFSMNTGAMQHWGVTSSSFFKATRPQPKEPAGSPARSHFQPGRRGTPTRPLTHPPTLAPRRPEGPVPSRPGLRPPNRVRTSRGRPRVADRRPRLRTAGRLSPPRGRPPPPRPSIDARPPCSLLTCARQGLAPASRPLPQSSCCSGAPGSPRRQPPPRASSRYRCAMAARTPRHRRPAPPDVTAPPRAFPLRPKGTLRLRPLAGTTPPGGHAPPSDHARRRHRRSPALPGRTAFSKSRDQSGWKHLRDHRVQPVTQHHHVT